MKRIVLVVKDELKVTALIELVEDCLVRLEIEDEADPAEPGHHRRRAPRHHRPGERVVDHVRRILATAPGPMTSAEVGERLAPLGFNGRSASPVLSDMAKTGEVTRHGHLWCGSGQVSLWERPG